MVIHLLLSVQFFEPQVQFRHFLPQLGLPKLLENVIRMLTNVPSALEFSIHDWVGMNVYEHIGQC